MGYRIYILFFVFFIAACSHSVKQAQTTAIDIDKLLFELPLERKIQFLSSNNMQLKSIPEYRIPAVNIGYGACGLSHVAEATAFPAPIMLAATWNTRLAAEVGKAIGAECNYFNTRIVWGADAGIYRLPQNGGNALTFGEDPRLATAITIPFIRGMQQNNVLVALNNFACGNHQLKSRYTNVIIDERSLHELHLPVFKAAIQQAGAAVVSNAQNLLNNYYCSENTYLLSTVLRDKWGFNGFVLSAPHSVHTPMAAVAGVDIEVPEAKQFNYTTMRPLIADRELSIAEIDNKIKRIIQTCQQAGLYQPYDSSTVIQWDKHRKLVENICLEGMVLLKNENNILPLDTNTIRSIAIYGRNAFDTPTGIGGKSYVTVENKVTLADAIKQEAVRHNIQVHEFKTELTKNDLLQNDKYLYSPSGKKGVLVKVFDKANFLLPPLSSHINSHAYVYLNKDTFGLTHTNWVEITGYIKVPESGNYLLGLFSDESGTVYINDRIKLLSYKHTPARMHTVTEYLTAGRRYSLRIVLKANAHCEYGFGLEKQDKYQPEQQIQQATGSDAVIVVVGFNESTEGMGHDRPYEIPARDSVLIHQLYAYNKNVIVILNAGGSVDCSAWNSASKALMHCFYAGQSTGKALNDIIFGRVSPTGRLPFTIEKHWSDAPAFYSYKPCLPGIDADNTGEEAHQYNTPNNMHYTEGVFSGYRHFDKNNIEPLYPFGYGLTYTHFVYDNIHLSEKIITKDQFLNAYVKISNTGDYDAAEVVQLYIHDLRAQHERPIKELKAFEKVFVKAGESKTVKFKITYNDLCYFNPDKNKWTTEAGEFMILVGSSFNQIKLTEKFNLE